MFTGIIEGSGTIIGIRSSGQGRQFTLQADFAPDKTGIGDSIAVSGACLTAVKIDGKRFQVDVAPETLSKTTFDKAKIGDRVNLERALRLSDRLDGHLVTGHIDGMGTINNRKTLGNAIIITIGVPDSLSYYMIQKGSVAVDGISLTINDCRSDNFDVSIIPHTAMLTTIGFKKIGDPVNIETDIIGKYVERFITKRPDGNNEKQSGQSSVDMELLVKTGFI
ncbi:MAG: riboflavin synthase [Desulfobacterales bacterium]|nr:riboflavin synthase [Desulfobacterales bacterium]